MQLEGDKLERLFATFFDITSLLHARRDRSAIFERVLDCCCDLLEADTSLLLLHQRGKLLKFWKEAGRDGLGMAELEATPAVVRWLEQEREPFLGAPGRWRLPVTTEVVRRGAGSLVCAPLVAKESHLGLLLAVRDDRPSGLDVGHLKILTALANQTAIAVENAELYERLMREAVTDGLTGVLNYRSLLQALRADLRRAQRYGHNVAFLMADVDHLKVYNERFGHLAGSEVLAQVARLLVSSCRNTDIVGKYGGDEFAVVLPQTGAEGASAVGERMRAAVEAHVFPHVAPGDITCSFGIAVFPDHGRESLQLILQADQALFRAKRAGKNTLRTAGPAAANASVPARVPTAS